jgi:hypothetical protein
VEFEALRGRVVCAGAGSCSSVARVRVAVGGAVSLKQGRAEFRSLKLNSGDGGVFEELELASFAVLAKPFGRVQKGCVVMGFLAVVESENIANPSTVPDALLRGVPNTLVAGLPNGPLGRGAVGSLVVVLD